jgi:uncharacterized RDD family membrane protein YckC
MIDVAALKQQEQDFWGHESQVDEGLVDIWGAESQVDEGFVDFWGAESQVDEGRVDFWGAESQVDEGRVDFWGAESQVDEKFAGNGRRVAGAAVDQAIVVAGAVTVLGFGLGVQGFVRGVVAALLAFAYFTVAIGHWGQTAGARVVSVRVTRADHDETPPGFKSAAIRAAAPALPVTLLTFDGVLSVLSVWSVLSVLSMLALCLVYAGLFRDRQRRGLHDKAAGTIVVPVPPGT